MVNPIESRALADRLVMAAIRLTRTLRALTKTFALSGPQVSALAVIVHAGRISAKDLAQLEEVTPSAISRTVSELEAAGLIRREADEADGRRQWIEATDEGRRTFSEGHSRRLEPLAGALAQMSVAERSHLADAIELIERVTASAARG